MVGDPAAAAGVTSIDFVLALHEVEDGWRAFAVIAHYQRYHGIIGCELIYRWHRMESEAILTSFEVVRMTPQQDELHRLIVRRISAGMTPEQAATEIMKMFSTIEDDWSEVDITTYGDGPGKVWIEQRDLVCRVPRQQTNARRVANRSV